MRAVPSGYPGAPFAGNQRRPQWYSHVCCGITTVLLLGVLVTLIVVPLSFQWVNYYEWGLPRNRLTKVVLYDKVYGVGRYHWGPLFTVVRFPRNYVFVHYTGENRLLVFSRSGLEFAIECSFQYRLRRYDIPKLFQKHSTTYPQQLNNIARSTLKNVAPEFSLDEFVTRRADVHKRMSTALQIALDALWVDASAGKFQLRNIELPQENARKFVEIFVQLQTNRKRLFEQEAILIREETKRLEATIVSNATTLTLRTRAESERLVSVARAEALEVTSRADAAGVSQLFNDLQIQSDADKATLVRVEGVDRAKDARILLGLEQTQPLLAIQ